MAMAAVLTFLPHSPSLATRDNLSRSCPSSFHRLRSPQITFSRLEGRASTAECFSYRDRRQIFRCNNYKEYKDSLEATKYGFGELTEADSAFWKLVRQTRIILQRCGKLFWLPLDTLNSIGNVEQHIHSWQHNAKRKGILVLIGSTVMTLLITLSVTASFSRPQAWALTEENLVFLEAWRTIDRAYIDKTFNGQNWFKYREDALKREPMNNREQTYTAIRKMLATLEDPFTRFLEPEKFKSLQSGTKGAVTGVGLEVGFDMSNDGSSMDLVVIAPVVGGPAERAGILPGDVILAIDGADTGEMTLYDAAQRLQGPDNSQVQLTLHGRESASRRTVTLQRQKITLNPVTCRLCELSTSSNVFMKIGYIRLITFNQNSAGAVKEAIQHLGADGAMAYVLDIRNNSGGLFPSGVAIAKLWLEKGVIVYIADSRGVRDIYEADGNGAIATREPLAVLVNKGTASASEILAGALKDNRRAVILGEPTFGKGKIQSVFELSDGSGMAVTVARYETPAHIDIDKVGIIPDYALPPSLPIDADSVCKCLIDSSLPCYISSQMLLSR